MEMLKYVVIPIVLSIKWIHHCLFGVLDKYGFSPYRGNKNF